MKCEYCGQECSDGLTFCSKCGKVFKKSGEIKKESSHSIVGVVLILVLLVIISIGYSFIRNIDNKNRELSNNRLKAYNEKLEKKLKELEDKECMIMKDLNS